MNYRRKDNIALLVLALPCIIYFFVWHYLPMAGLVLAFKNYTYTGGVFGSDWIGFRNFTFLFSSQDAVRLIRNTVGYSIAFMIVGNFFAIAVALAIFEIQSRTQTKIYQTVLILPRFLSWVVVGYISYIFLSPTQGVFNLILRWLGAEPVSWYQNPGYWPFILTFFNTWKNVGLNSIMYYAALMAIDTQLFEAARIDGANRWQQILHISIPSVISLLTILMLLDLGRTFRGDFGLNFQIPRDIGLLYPATDIIDTYVYRGLREGAFAISTAVGLFQSVAGLIMILISNRIVSRINPERALF